MDEKKIVFNYLSKSKKKSDWLKVPEISKLKNFIPDIWKNSQPKKKLNPPKKIQDKEKVRTKVFMHAFGVMKYKILLNIVMVWVLNQSISKVARSL